MNVSFTSLELHFVSRILFIRCVVFDHVYISRRTKVNFVLNYVTLRCNILIKIVETPKVGYNLVTRVDLLVKIRSTVVVFGLSFQHRYEVMIFFDSRVFYSRLNFLYCKVIFVPVSYDRDSNVIRVQIRFTVVYELSVIHIQLDFSIKDLELIRVLVFGITTILVPWDLCTGTTIFTFVSKEHFCVS